MDNRQSVSDHTYTRLINTFWSIDKTACFSGTETRFYFLLLDYAHHSDWTDPVSIPDSYLVEGLDCSRSTIWRVRNRMKQLGLIDFKSTPGRGNPTQYTICFMDETNDETIKGIGCTDETIKSEDDRIGFTHETFNEENEGICFMDETIKTEDEGICFMDETINGICFTDETFNGEDEKKCFTHETYSETYDETYSGNSQGDSDLEDWLENESLADDALSLCKEKKESVLSPSSPPFSPLSFSPTPPIPYPPIVPPITSFSKEKKETPPITCARGKNETLPRVEYPGDAQVDVPEQDQKGNGVESTKRKPQKQPELPEDGISVVGKVDHIDYEEIKNHWNNVTKGSLGTIRSFSEERKQKIRARIRETSKEEFFEMMDKVMESDFLRGENDRGWMASFDFCLKPSKYPRILEGFYSNERIGRNRDRDAPIQRVTDSSEGQDYSITSMRAFLSTQNK